MSEQEFETPTPTAHIDLAMELVTACYNVDHHRPDMVAENVQRVLALRHVGCHTPYSDRPLYAAEAGFLWLAGVVSTLLDEHQWRTIALHVAQQKGQ